MNSTIDRLSYLNPTEYEYTTTDDTFNPCRNLNDIFGSDDVAIDSENLRVYLRVRPSLPDENLRNEEFQVDLLDRQNIVLTAPASSNTFKNSSHGVGKLCQKFTFSRIYDPATTQKELFEESTLGLVNDFVSGQNILLFTYGATNSGKTFTVQGTPSEPGILPRTLDHLFKSIGDRHYPNNDLKPRYFCGISRLEEKDIKREEEKKRNIFKSSLENGSRFSMSTSTLSKFSSDLSLDDTQPSSNSSAISSVIEVPNSNEDTSFEIVNPETTVYAVFVSFAEIYNEYIHDLLEQMSPSKKNKRNPLMLGEDRNASIYVKGLQEVRINSAEEAWQLLEIGRQNLHFAATRLNHNSSRSHCIFTIKVVRLADAKNPHVARVSMMSICDLAGAERAGKTKSNQDRLKEAGNINSSLLVLSRCLDALRQNQIQKGSKKREVPVPYRDSKLTRLFQSFFLGRGKAAMIVNISRSPLMFDETLQVLKFSAIAKQVALTHAKEPECHLAVPKRISRQSYFSKFVRSSLNSSGRLSVPWMKDTNITFGESDHTRIEDPSVIVEEDEGEEADEKYEALLKVIADLRDKLIQENKEKNELEDQLRNELCTEFSQQLVEIENSWSQRLKDQQAKSEEFSEWRISALMKSMKKSNGRKRLRPDDDPDEEYVSSILLVREEQKVKDHAAHIEQLEMERKHLHEEIEAMRQSQKKTNEQANRAQEENSKLTFQLAQLTRSFDEAQKQVEETRKRRISEISETQEIQALQNRLDENLSLLSHHDGEILALKKMLVEAAEEFIIKEEVIDNLTKTLEKKEKENRKQLMTINELESQLLETSEVMSQHALQLEERDQTISELEEQLSIIQNVEDAVSEIKKLRTVTESYQTQILILEQNLTATEKERNKAEKELQEISVKKRQIEEDFLRDKSKLLLELANLKRNHNANGLSKSETSPELKEAIAKVAELQRETEMLKQENGHLNNQITETNELFEHVKNVNVQLESHQKVLLKEKEIMCQDLEKLNKKLVEIQEGQASQQEDTSTLKANNVSITNQVNTLLNKLQDSEELIKAMSEQLIQKQTLYEDITSEKENLEREKEELLQRVENLKESLDVLTNTKAAGNEELITECNKLKEELGTVKEENETLSIGVEKCKSLQDSLDAFEEKLTPMIENIELREQKLADQVKKSEDLIQKLKSEKESSVKHLNEVLELKEDTINRLKLESEQLQGELEEVKQSLEKRKESELCLRETLHQKEAELEENMTTFTKQESLEEVINSLKVKLADEKKGKTSLVEKLKLDLETEIKLKVDIENQKCEFENLLSTRESELEDLVCAKEKLNEDLEDIQHLLSKYQEKLEVSYKEKELLNVKVTDLEKVVGAVQKENTALTTKLDEAEQHYKEIKDSEQQLHAQVDEANETKAEMEHIKSASQLELLSCKEELQKIKASIETHRNENISLKGKIHSSNILQEEMVLKLKEKDEVISSLGLKVESLDRKLTKTEDEFEDKKKNLQQELISAKNKCDMLEKEVRAVREARVEEVSQYSNQAQEHEEQLRLKDTEVSTLQQEIKKLLQQSMSSSLCNVSQSTTSDTPSIKRETNDHEKDIVALREEIRQREIKNDSLLQEVTDLRGQLENLSLSHSTQKLPTKRPQRKVYASSQGEDVASDVESISEITPGTGTKRSARKTRTPAVTPAEKSCVHLDSTTEDIVPQIKVTSATKKEKTTKSRPQRSSRVAKKLDQSFDYSDDKVDDIWEPPVSDKKSSRGGGSRKPRGQKAKTSQIFNPHLNQENNSILANKDSENLDEDDFKAPQQRRRRHLFKSANDDMYTGSPILVEVPRQDDSPHSVVRRQLRSKRK